MNSVKMSVLTMLFPPLPLVLVYNNKYTNAQTKINRSISKVRKYFLFCLCILVSSHTYIFVNKRVIYVLITQYFHSKLHFINGSIFMICSSRDEKQYGALLLMPSASFMCIYLHFLQKITTLVILTIK